MINTFFFSNLVINAAKNNPSALVNEAQSLAAIALATARDIEAFAATVDDPVKKKRLLDNAAGKFLKTKNHFKNHNFSFFFKKKPRIEKCHSKTYCCS